MNAHIINNSPWMSLRELFRRNLRYITDISFSEEKCVIENQNYTYYVATVYYTVGPKSTPERFKVFANNIIVDEKIKHDLLNSNVVDLWVRCVEVPKLPIKQFYVFKAFFIRYSDGEETKINLVNIFGGRWIPHVKLYCEARKNWESSPLSWRDPIEILLDEINPLDWRNPTVMPADD